MSKQTPRRGRNKRSQQGNLQAPSAAVGASDIESDFNNNNNNKNGISDGQYADAARLAASAGAPQGAHNRGLASIPDMNLHVLRRYEPSIRTILSIAASTVVYVLNYDTGGWEKPDPYVEGTLFLCEQDPLVLGSYTLPRACVFVLNRKGLHNVMVDLAKVDVAEVTANLITLRIDKDEQEQQRQQQKQNTSGADGEEEEGEEEEEFDPQTVLERWQSIRSSLESLLGTADLAQTGPVLEAGTQAYKLERTAAGEDPDGLATRVLGGRPSIRELVATALGHGGGGGGGQNTAA